MILRLSQKLSTKNKSGTLKAMPLDDNPVWGLVVSSVHGSGPETHLCARPDTSLLFATKKGRSIGKNTTDPPNVSGPLRTTLSASMLT